MMKNKIKGVVERFALAPHANGTGVYLLIVGDDNVYYFQDIRRTYYQENDFFPENDYDFLAALTQAGDHVWFQSEATFGVQFSYRNWTLEHRLFGETKNIHNDESLLEIGPIPL